MPIGSWPPSRSRPAYDDILCDVRFDAAFLPPDSDLTHLKEEIENRIVSIFLDLESNGLVLSRIVGEVKNKDIEEILCKEFLLPSLKIEKFIVSEIFAATNFEKILGMQLLISFDYREYRVIY